MTYEQIMKELPGETQEVLKKSIEIFDVLVKNNVKIDKYEGIFNTDITSTILKNDDKAAISLFLGILCTDNDANKVLKKYKFKDNILKYLKLDINEIKELTDVQYNFYFQKYFNNILNSYYDDDCLIKNNHLIVEQLFMYINLESKIVRDCLFSANQSLSIAKWDQIINNISILLLIKNASISYHQLKLIFDGNLENTDYNGMYKNILLGYRTEFFKLYENICDNKLVILTGNNELVKEYFLFGINHVDSYFGEDFLMKIIPINSHLLHKHNYNSPFFKKYAQNITTQLQEKKAACYIDNASHLIKDSHAIKLLSNIWFELKIRGISLILTAKDEEEAEMIANEIYANEKIEYLNNYNFFSDEYYNFFENQQYSDEMVYKTLHINDLNHEINYELLDMFPELNASKNCYNLRSNLKEYIRCFLERKNISNPKSNNGNQLFNLDDTEIIINFLIDYINNDYPIIYNKKGKLNINSPYLNNTKFNPNSFINQNNKQQEKIIQLVKKNNR